MKHPGINPEHWYGDEKIKLPDASVVPADERDAELRRGLAHRDYPKDYPMAQRQRVAERLERLADGAEKDSADPFDRRMSWQELYDMFRTLTAVSSKRATEWADRIVERGVQQR